jgi:hypothetical protein
LAKTALSKVAYITESSKGTVYSLCLFFMWKLCG